MMINGDAFSEVAETKKTNSLLNIDKVMNRLWSNSNIVSNGENVWDNAQVSIIDSLAEVNTKEAFKDIVFLLTKRKIKLDSWINERIDSKLSLEEYNLYSLFLDIIETKDDLDKLYVLRNQRGYVDGDLEALEKYDFTPCPSKLIERLKERAKTISEHNSEVNGSVWAVVLVLGIKRSLMVYKHIVFKYMDN